MELDGTPGASGARKGSLLIVSFLRVSLIVAAVFVRAWPCQADGICRNDRMPLDFVPVKAFSSPQCPGFTGNPFVMNAWEVTKAKDGVLACELPKYQDIGATAASLIPCDRVHQDACPARSDGLPNAFYLRSPKECLDKGLPRGTRLLCGSLSYPQFREEGEVVIAELSRDVATSKCAEDDEAYLVKRYDGNVGDWIAACDVVDTTSRYQYSSSPDLAVRRFYSPYCSPRKPSLNAVILVPRKAMLNQRVVACGYLEFKLNKHGNPIIRFGGGGEAETWPPTRYAKECGGVENRPNAYLLKLGPNGRAKGVR